MAATVPRMAAEQLSADEFKLQYMLKNQPVILTHVQLLHTAAQWITTSGGEARVDVLRKHFADTAVPVTNVNALYGPLRGVGCLSDARAHNMPQLLNPFFCPLRERVNLMF